MKKKQGGLCMEKIIDGKQIAKDIRAGLKEEVTALKEKTGKVPGLAVVLVGDDPASHTYVRMKEKACNNAGILSRTHRLPSTTSQEELLNMVKSLNEDDEIHGILVQLPLPKGLDEQEILYTIDPEKDVDGFHPVNVGRLMTGDPSFIPCTPRGIIELLDRTGVELKGKKAVVVGRSNIVGKPAALLLLQRHATVTICHSRTSDLPGEVRKADVVVAAVGRPEMVKGDWIKEGAIVIDVGVNRVDDKLVGDVAFDEAKEKAAAITPVPGGVGPMTIAMLLQNTLESFKNHG